MAEPTAKKVKNILTFKMCICGNPNPHGYFYLPNGKRSPPAISKGEGRMFLDIAEQAGVISSEEKALHLDELATSELPEDRPSDEENAANDLSEDDRHKLKLRLMSKLNISVEQADRVIIIHL
jgi:hypothetical protein